jgi:SM-20-related protein
MIDANPAAISADPLSIRITGGLESRGLAVVDDFLGPAELRALQDVAAVERPRMAPATVGRTRRLDPAIRSDRIAWLDLAGGPAPVLALAGRLLDLGRAINAALLLGLWDLELHFALYRPGDAYVPHRDRLAADDVRVLSCVIYLNNGWRREDRGELRLYRGEASGAFEDVLPLGGRLVVFLSDLMLHEVRPATRERLSLAGWFKRRRSTP